MDSLSRYSLSTVNRRSGESQASLRGGARCKSSEECNGARENSSEDEEMTVMIMTMKADYYYYSVR
jgi:hypothetical protein